MPVPPVYVLDEAGINAFAAGYGTDDAVVGVTRGCMETLSRDELQGVVGHEFSHVLNGDMRLNLRLAAVLFGILAIGVIGRSLVGRRGYGAAAFGNSRGRGSSASQIAILALGLMAIGYVGTFFGNLIKAAVSRQRESHHKRRRLKRSRSLEVKVRLGGSGSTDQLEGGIVAGRLHLNLVGTVVQ